jgi:hypothetical protein
VKITATCLSLSPPTAAVHFQPHWLSRALAAASRGLFGRRSYTRHAQTLDPQSATWIWSDTRRVVDDEVFVVLRDAHITAAIDQAAREIAAAWRAALVTTLSPVDFN